MGICQATGATDSSNTDVGQQGSSLVQLGNQVSRLGFCSSQTGHTKPPRRTKHKSCFQRENNKGTRVTASERCRASSFCLVSLATANSSQDQ